jgi:hypothetical protein
MFDRFKKALSQRARNKGDSAAPSSQFAPGAVSEWAATQGFGLSFDSTAQQVALEGSIRGKPWRMQLGSPSREYIRGEEVRGRAQLGFDEDVAILVMNRPLKEALEKQAYHMYTDTLQTSTDPRLPEEMRWLAMYDEVAWEELPMPFWERYGVLADRRESAVSWMTSALARTMLQWPEPAPLAEVPFVLLLLRGKVYLRMEYNPPQLTTLQHAALIFTSACESAMAALPAERH